MKMKLLLCVVLLSVATAVDSIPDLSSLAAALQGNSKLVCTGVSTPGLSATCPDGYIPTTCVCTKGCVSWSVQRENTCLCQCPNVDMTTARCCKVGY
ncbi:resistin-like beta [Rana temporaria]|uniref:resistin-like beta n=1 Tax=Rana temporaria TaxID=8407 RepID=UPI001AAD64A7|nr:resistin-like beta [Rana temporaria]